MGKYKKIFYNKIKSLFPYFIKFLDNKFKLSKTYSENCIIGGPNWRLIIMITYDKSTFSINNNKQKIWTLNRHCIL